MSETILLEGATRQPTLTSSPDALDDYLASKLRTGRYLSSNSGRVHLNLTSVDPTLAAMITPPSSSLSSSPSSSLLSSLPTDSKWSASSLIASKPLPKTISEAPPQPLPTAGPKWFNMVGLDQKDPSVARSIQILKARHVLDTKKFYKKTESPGSCVQIGTVINGAGDVGRLSRRERGRELVGEVMKDETVRAKLKERYLKVQQHRMSMKSKPRKSNFNKKRK